MDSRYFNSFKSENYVFLVWVLYRSSFQPYNCHTEKAIHFFLLKINLWLNIINFFFKLLHFVLGRYIIYLFWYV